MSVLWRHLAAAVLLLGILAAGCANPLKTAPPSSPCDDAAGDAERLQRILKDIQESSDEAEDVTFLSDLYGPDARRAIPIEDNEQVGHFVNLFTGPQKGWVRRSLERSGRYQNRMREIFREEGLPEELVYLALIESGYNPHAYSRAGAMGIWQFMEATGRRYGLVINWWVDERRDLEKSTRAAALYLKDLYALFEDWHLAAAAYNAGEGKLQRGLERYGTDNFWNLSQEPYLKLETRNYVPRFLAVLTIARAPETYGFGDLNPEPPLLYETVEISHPMDLAVAAAACGTDLEHLKRLNPQLHRGCTPPHYPGNYEIKIPLGSRERFVATCDRLDPQDQLAFVRHAVRRGETLSYIARRYGVPVSAITEVNGMRSRHRIRVGESIIVPLPARFARSSLPAADPAAGDRLPARARTAERSYRVRSGDSLWSIARRHGVTVDDLRRWNRLGTASRLHPGQRLLTQAPDTARSRTVAAAPAAPANAQKQVYRVRKGDSLWSIACRHQVTLASLMRWNRLDRSAEIHPGQDLVIWREPAARSARKAEDDGASRRTKEAKATPSRHTVRQGDTLWNIARRYKVSLSDLCLWNNIDTRQTLQPGLRLDIGPQSRLGRDGADLLAERTPDRATP